MHPDVQKRLPACDICKLRRVKCDPVPPPEACSRCISKGIVCTTTIVKRNKSLDRAGKRIQAAKNAFGTIRPLHEANPVPLVRAETYLTQLELAGELTTHLLEIHANVPSDDIVPGASLIEQFEASGRRISVLPKPSQVLAFCIITLTARISSHPLLFGPTPLPPRLATILFESSTVDINSVSEWGRRRENACERLREMAVESAWHAKLLGGDGGARNGFAGVSDEGMAACMLLDAIEDRYEQGRGQVWGAAFVALLRRKLDAKRKAEWASSSSKGVYDVHDESAMSTSSPSTTVPAKARHAPRIPGLAWSIQLMREALSSAARGQLCSYTLHDEEMVAGLRPISPEKVLEHADSFGIAESHPPRNFYEGEGSRADWWDFGSYYALGRPFTYRMTEIALGSYEWTLRRTHRVPFSIPHLKAHLASIAPLQNLTHVDSNRLKLLLSPAAVDIRRRTGRGAAFRSATGEEPGELLHVSRDAEPLSGGGMAMQGADGAPGAHSPRDELRAQEMARTLQLLVRGCLAASLFPVYNDLRERLRADEEGAGCPGDERGTLEGVLGALTRALLPQARAMLRSVRAVVHLAWVTNIGRSIRLSLSSSSSSAARSSGASSASSMFVSARAGPSTPATDSVNSASASYSEDRPGCSGTPLQCGLLYPSSFAWEAKIVSLLRLCISPHLFARASWNEPFSIWAQVLLDSPPIGDGGMGFTKAEKIADLECLLDVARIMAWSYPTLDDDLIQATERMIERLKAEEHATSQPTGSAIRLEPAPSLPSSRGRRVSRAQGHTLLQGAATSGASVPTVKEALEGVPHERISEVFFGGNGPGSFGVEGSEHGPGNDLVECLAAGLDKLGVGDVRADGDGRGGGDSGVPALDATVLMSGLSSSTSHAQSVPLSSQMPLLYTFQSQVSGDRFSAPALLSLLLSNPAAPTNQRPLSGLAMGIEALNPFARPASFSNSSAPAELALGGWISGSESSWMSGAPGLDLGMQTQVWDVPGAHAGELYLQNVQGDSISGDMRVPSQYLSLPMPHLPISTLHGDGANQSADSWFSNDLPPEIIPQAHQPPSAAELESEFQKLFEGQGLAHFGSEEDRDFQNVHWTNLTSKPSSNN